jgi:hypothetical protein
MIMGFDFGGDFDMGDAAIIGGIMGFAEEAIRDEQLGEGDGVDLDIKIDPSKINDVNLRLVYNQDPEFFIYIVKLVIKQNRKWRNERLAREAVKDELEALQRSEELLEEEENAGD